MSGGLASLAACCVLAALVAAGRRLDAPSSARRLVGVSCAALALLVGCGGEAAPPSTSPTAERPTTAAHTTPPLSAAAQARADARQQRRAQLELERTFAPNPWRAPGDISPHRSGAPKRLIVHEVKRGRGPPLKGDESVWVNYVLTWWRTGHKAVVAWSPGNAAYFSIPALAPGIRRGMIGMRPGGRRTIAMPAAIADVHEEKGRNRPEGGNIDVVLRNIIRLPSE